MKWTFLILLFAFFNSCTSLNFYGDENLGSGYVLCKDGKYQFIEYFPKNKYKNGGYPVIKENVTGCNFNEFVIIVKTSNYNKSYVVINKYWIIDKGIPIVLKDFKNQNDFDKLLKIGIIGPMDSIEFYKTLKLKNIKLDFK